MKIVRVEKTERREKLLAGIRRMLSTPFESRYAGFIGSKIYETTA